MAIATGKLMLTMMHPEMLFVAHVHQPIVASPAVHVDDASRAAYLTQDPACSSFLEASGTISDTGSA